MKLVPKFILLGIAAVLSSCALPPGVEESLDPYANKDSALEEKLRFYEVPTKAITSGDLRPSKETAVIMGIELKDSRG